MRKLLYYLKKYIANLPFLTAAAIMGWILYQTNGLETQTSVDLLQGLQQAFQLSYATYITPILACFPYVMKFHEEKNNKSYQYAILRIGKLRYAARKVTEAAISGALVMLAASLIYSIISIFMSVTHGVPLTFDGGGIMGNSSDDPIRFYYVWITEGFGFGVYLVNIIMLMVQGAFWTCVGTIVAVFVSNKRLAVISPFLIKKIIIYAITQEELFFLLPTNLDFGYWTTVQPFGGIPYMLLYLISSIVISVIIVYCGMNRTMKG